MKIGLLAVVVLGLVLAPSCGDQSGGGGGGGSAAATVVGRWTIDPESMVQAKEEEARKQGGEAKDSIEAMRPVMKQMAEGMKATFDIKSGGEWSGSMTMVGIPGTPPTTSTSKGTWKLSGEDLELTSTEEDGKKKDSPETQRGKFKGGRIEFQLPDGPLLVLKRA
jgi:hypothetical protein